LAARLHEEAAEQAEAARREFDTKTTEHAAALLAAKLENSKMFAHVREVEAALEQQDATLARLQGELQRESTGRQVADLKERLTENEAHRLSIEEKHQHARDALEHYRQSVKEQREADARRHEQQVQQLQAELRLAQQTIAVKQEETTRLNQEGARLIAELTHARQSLSAEEERGKRQLRELEDLRTIAARHDVLTAQAAEREAHAQDLRQQLAAITEKLDNLIDQVRGVEQALAQASARAEAHEGVAMKLQTLLEGSMRLPDGLQIPEKR